LKWARTLLRRFASRKSTFIRMACASFAFRNVATRASGPLYDRGHLSVAEL
jgi:hypothetical protein